GWDRLYPAPSCPYRRSDNRRCQAGCQAALWGWAAGDDCRQAEGTDVERNYGITQPSKFPRCAFRATLGRYQHEHRPIDRHCAWRAHWVAWHNVRALHAALTRAEGALDWLRAHHAEAAYRCSVCRKLAAIWRTSAISSASDQTLAQLRSRRSGYCALHHNCTLTVPIISLGKTDRAPLRCQTRV